jgi:hypothetical protein
VAPSLYEDRAPNANSFIVTDRLELVVGHYVFILVE